MASSKLFMVLVIAAIFVPSISAVEYVVGDDKGWTTYFDYQSWANGKVFFVGDKLVFKYKQGTDSVLRVNGTGFQQCEAPYGTQPLTSGNDVVILATPGRKWYISGVSDHCEFGNQKLAITVLPPWTFPPSLPPAPSPSEASTSQEATTGGAGSDYSWNAPVSPPYYGSWNWYPWPPMPSPSASPSTSREATTGGAGSDYSWNAPVSPPYYSSWPWYPWPPMPSPSASPSTSPEATTGGAASDYNWNAPVSSPYHSRWSWYPWSPMPSPSASPAARAAGSRTAYSRISRW
ncbi:hypothetical protein FNV43_RR09154 [Rhamnella rubrinervis]|uniref:Phytocyanin domain-containing protein n=1 Tax=Rhamnella rubrinervis TaxID=2594499 RepID=A0A8K0H9H7_9ROSA|nr:hypothetical protein FNV43_RR09154 [Rhamnella rubrinervis]